MITNINTLGSLFDSLAVELQTEIFSHSLVPFTSLAAGEGPLKLCHVCRAWRALAVDTPELWSSFTISDNINTDALQFYLRHSRSHPLSIRVVDADKNRFADLALIPRAHLHRSRCLDLSIPSQYALGLFSTPSNLTALQHLHLTTHKSSSRLPFLFDIHALQIPWGQLASLHLSLDHGELPTLDDCYAILSRCVSLESCSLKATYSSLSRHAASPLPLPLLRTFRLRLLGEPELVGSEMHGIGLAKFMSAFSATQLQSLRIEWLVDGISTKMPWPKNYVGIFLGGLRSLSSRVTRLHLAYLPLLDVDLLELLRELPHITRLTVKFSLSGHSIDAITNNLLNALVVVPHHHTVLPLLESISVQCSGDWYCNTTMLGLIRSRRSPSVEGVILKSFHLTTMKAVSAGFSEQAMGWVDEGLKTRIDIISLP
ncbi:hypothetical protein BDN72DRAFT_893156 [Pluteus cervinus]|uniref:Uncharacterized protein n=1 Tax=Pluteus cervinus TaxID=181527 RepID=A0ACD3B979_9AGAR|nr:hypothetical protein BDN72DRAFT_893156 [Pluteus cervinus]